MSGLEERVDDAERSVRRASDNPIVRAVARSGYVASALLRGMIGVLALLLAAHVDGPAPGASGAFGAIAAVPGGVLLLALVAGGNGALFLWLLIQGALVDDGELLERWRQRLVFWGRGAVYGVIGLAAVRFALGAHAVDADARRAASRELLEVPGGQVAVVLVGAVVLIVGASMVWLGASRRFVKTIRLPDDARRRRAVLVLGAIAYVAQGATVLLVGGTLLVAAWTVDATRIGGLDEALADFPSTPFGQALLIAIGVGWILAGLYALVRARIARTA
ncbi:DUF1206 domain-containing protein [Amnibacterium kyonggiense]|uniref:Uncharacterized protein DUF1206 n=1 Tax=Amnibacterium kyonggiense TaxID=595671 RepID=A0A4R7FT11_9MICO|nr:DUF1206 domain-containing protein [Amnibacterium kyonggiense]TDS80918.1 uncharacterized protein DUF1206 [Amnibacterium kyonggiense]